MMTRIRNYPKGIFALAPFVLLAAGSVLLADHKPNHSPGGGGGDDEPISSDVSYCVKLLGTLGGAWSKASAMNELGDVVGYSTTGEVTDDGDSIEEPLVYFNNTGTMHHLRDLVNTEDQTYWIWRFARPQDINSSGQICMQLSSNASGTFESHGVRITLAFDDSGVVVPGKGFVEVAGPSEALGINEFGDVTGTADEAWVYSEDFGTRFIGNLGGDFATGAAINNLGEVTGTSDKVAGERRAFRYVPGTGMQDLGVIEGTPDSFGNDDSWGNDINDQGVVVGSAVAGKHKGFKTVHAFREAGSGMEDLGALGGAGNWSWAWSVNTDGWVIGESEVDDGSRREFLFADQFGMVELEPLIVGLPAGSALVDAAEINDVGEIGATISYGDGTGEAVLLTPNP